MAQRIARAALYRPAADMDGAIAAAARFAIVTGSAAALILAGPFLPF
ncbi:hypothetical protein [Croceicoccus marinus]|nr:hypothetical protein [Croceicoccus marinus]